MKAPPAVPWAAAAPIRLVLLLALAAPVAARAQEGELPPEESIGTPDSVFQVTEKIPLTYLSTYDRDRASGTWTQYAAYGIHRGPLAVDLSGGSSMIDDILGVGIGSRGGQFSGNLNYRASRSWILSMTGQFQANRWGSAQSGSRQHQNRITLRSQYSAGPWKGLSFRGLLSTEFQRDHNLSYQPRDATRTDSYSHRDSTTVEGRNDGVSAQLSWKPLAALSATLQGSGSRANPVTRTLSRDFLLGSAGGGQRITSDTTITSPLDNSNLLAKLGFSGIPKVTAGLQVKRVQSIEEYFDPLVTSPTGTTGNQEHTSLDLRAGTLHLESQPRPALLVSADGTLSETFRQFRLRTSSTSRVRTQQLQTLVSYSRPEKRGSIRFEVSRAKNDRQRSQNGILVTRFLTGAAAGRVTSRLWLDGTGTATLISYQYEYPATTTPLSIDRDEVRTFFNLGGGYAISSQCSTTVHFSTSRGHTVFIGAQSSGLNAVQTNYQMDATLQLRASRRVSIRQNYLLSAAYQIYDYAEPQNILIRIKRIDTVITDTLFPFVYANVAHNYLFRDVGPYERPAPGEKRLYNPTSETYQQNLSVTVGVQLPTGITAYVTQNLANTRDRSLYTGTETAMNRWTLTCGGTMSRAILGGAQLQASARHVGAFTEPPFDRQEEAYWVVNAALQTAF